VGIELGTFKGESAEWMLENIFTHEKARYYCVDTFEGSVEHKLGKIDCSQNETITRARLARFGDLASIWKGATESFLSEFLAGTPYPFADFVYIDAAHDAKNVLRDAVMSFALLKIGGVMVFDDYRWTVMPDELDRPAMAIDAFIMCYSRQLEVLDTGWQVAVKKISE
jgi:predicted O-methyltransferase YrrM